MPMLQHELLLHFVVHEVSWRVGRVGCPTTHTFQKHLGAGPNADVIHLGIINVWGR